MNKKDEKFCKELGEFLVNFENLLNILKDQIYWLCVSVGLPSQDVQQRCIYTLLSRMEAMEVIKSFNTILKEVYKDNLQEAEKLKLLINAIKDVCELRNELIHRQYFIGYGTDTTSSYNHKKTGKGLEWKQISFCHSDIKEMNNTLKKMIDLFRAILPLHSEALQFGKDFREYTLKEFEELRGNTKKWAKNPKINHDLDSESSSE